jgi:tetratricopeptide (TPR) repeat protein
MPRTLAVAVLGLWLAGCSLTSNGGSDALGLKADGSDAFAAVPPPEAAKASEPPPPGVATEGDAGLLGSDPNDDLSVGKKYYRARNFGMAERYFRRAVELHPRDAEAWLDLAAAYDRLRRFDLADRAYGQATGLLGPTAEVLNNQGYSYMLRGDYKRAQATLLTAQHKDPSNPYIANNLQLLAQSWTQAKQVE